MAKIRASADDLLTSVTPAFILRNDTFVVKRGHTVKMKVNSADVSTLGRKCGTEAGKVADVQKAIQSQIASTDWDSPAAKKFKDDWSTKFAPALKDLNKALAELGKAAQTMAKNYEEADAAYKGAKG